MRGIGRDAFEGCVLLTDITIPRSVEEIGDYAFDRCRELKSVHISEGVKQIGAHAFQNCTTLTDIRVPKNVERIGAYAFCGLSGACRIGYPWAHQGAWRICLFRMQCTDGIYDSQDCGKDWGLCVFRLRILKSITIPAAV